MMAGFPWRKNKWVTTMQFPFLSLLCRKLVNNHVFFQHPDLIRILRVHENVMALMMNTLGRAQAQSDAQEKSQAASPEGEQAPKEKVCHCSLFVSCPFLFIIQA